MVFVLSEMRCLAEDAHKVRALAHAQFATHRMAPGWRGCRVGFSLFQHGQLIVFEQWATLAAFHRHLQSGRGIAFLNAIQSLLTTEAVSRIITTANDDLAADIIDATTIDFLVYQARCRSNDAAEARETLSAVDALFQTCPGFLGSYLAEDIFEPGCFLGVAEWRDPRDAKAASVEPELLRLAVAAAPLFRDPLRFRLLNAASAESTCIQTLSLAEHLADVFA